MAHTLVPAPHAPGRWRAAPLAALRSMWQRDDGKGDAAAFAVDLRAGLAQATESGKRLTEKIHAGTEEEPLANAASICRWELLILRERLLEADVPGVYRQLRAQVVRELEATAAAARSLSSGYRFHNLNRICEGGQAFDEHLETLQQMHARLTDG